MNYRVESLLSARLFLFPQHADGRIYFLSNLSGHLSLYVMNYGGSMPEPLLPPNIALQNPELIGGYSYYVFPKIRKTLPFSFLPAASWRLLNWPNPLKNLSLA